MSRRVGIAEALAAVYQAFFDQKTWIQADLAREVSISVERLRELLNTLEAQGWPFEKQNEPPHVYWSLPRDWFPEGVIIRAGDVPDLLRLFARMPRTGARDRIVGRITRGAKAEASTPVWLVPQVDPKEESHLPIVEDSARRGEVLHMHYYSVRRGVCDWRDVSVQRLQVGEVARFCAICHREDELRWWRVDRILDARLAGAGGFRTAEPAALENFIEKTVNGFFASGEEIESRFFVRDPEARWVRQNLPRALAVETSGDGIRVRAKTAALLPIARIVVGLGAAARAETPELRGIVAELARGALGSS